MSKQRTSTLDRLKKYQRKSLMRKRSNYQTDGEIMIHGAVHKMTMQVEKELKREVSQI